MKTLNVMDLDFNYLAGIQGYSYAIVERVWNSIGSLVFELSGDIPNSDLIQEDCILWFDQEYHKAYIVERIEEELKCGVVTYTITARHINCFLADFITFPPSESAYDSETGTREQIVRAWVDANCISPTQGNRVQMPIALGSYQGYGSLITDQTRYKNLAEELTRILDAENLSWGLELDIPNSQLIFNVCQGTDRTKDAASYEPRVLFGLKYGNMVNYRKVIDKTAAKTVAYVGGQGSGASRTIVEVSTSGSGRRKEVFVDARDISATDDLTERGNQKLSEAAEITNFEFEVLNRQFTYENDYDLGDFVTIVVDKDNYQNRQIRKVKEVYEKGNIQVVPEFGEPENSLGEIIKSISKRISGLENQ